MIDAYAGNTGDLARRDGHFYCDKAPGTSWLAVPAYVIARAAGATLDGAAHAATAFAVGLPAALALAPVFSIARALGSTGAGAALVSIAYGFGTLAFPYATLFNGHQLCASLLVCAFALLVGSAPLPRASPPESPARHAGRTVQSPLRDGGAGLLMGAAIAVEYQAVLAVGVLVVYALAGRRDRPVAPAAARLAAGLALTIAAVLAYHAVAFGSPFRNGYAFSTQEHRAMGLFMGIGAPSAAAAVSLLFSPTRGLLYAAPWLALAAWGLVRLARSPHRPEAIACAAIVAAYFLLSISLVDWEGGWAIGPRYMVPALPFLALGAVGLSRALSTQAAPLAGATGVRTATASERHAVPSVTALRRPGPVQLIAAVALAYSIAMLLAATVVQPEINTLKYPRPFAERIWPALVDGRVAINTQSIDERLPDDGPPAAWNLGQRLGLDGLTSLFPLALTASLTSLWLFRAVRRADTVDSQVS